MSELDRRLRDGLRRAADPPVEVPPGLAEELVRRGAAASSAGGAATRWLFGGTAIVAATTTIGWLGLVGRPAGTTEAVRVDVGSAQVAYRDCPGGVPLGVFVSNDRVLAVARNDGWIGVRLPSDVSRTVWLPSQALRADDPQLLAALPLARCLQGEAIVASGPFTTVAGSTTTSTSTSSTSSSLPAATSTVPPTTQAVAPTTQATVPTTNPPSPTTTQPPPPTTAPDQSPPSLANVGASPTSIKDLGGAGVCVPPGPNVATVSAFASDPQSGIADVQLLWAVTQNGSPVAGGSGSTAMSPAGGGTFTGSVGPFDVLGGSENGVVTITVRAKNGAGLTVDATTSVTLVNCNLI
jgi:hypothetical protein